MPAKSKSQQRLMGMVYALKSGKLKTEDLPSKVAEKVKSVAKGMSKKSAKDFAETKHKNLPSKVKESVDLSNISLLETLQLCKALDEMSNDEQQQIDTLLEIRDLKLLQQKEEKQKR